MILAAVVLTSVFKTTLLLASDRQSIKLYIRNESDKAVTILDPVENGIRYDLKLVKRRPGRKPDWDIACGPYSHARARTIDLEPKEIVERDFELEVGRQYAGTYVGRVKYQDEGTYEDETFTPVGMSRIYKLSLVVHPKGTYTALSLK